MLVFSRATALTLMGMTVGTALVLIGLYYTYRPASFLGMLVVCTVAAASIEIPTLTEISSLLTAMLGLLLPAFALSWLALTAEEGEKRDVTLMRKPLVVAIFYAIVSLWSVSLTILVMSFFIPTISMRLSVIAEAAILIIATIIGGVLLMRRVPATVKQATEKPSE